MALRDPLPPPIYFVLQIFWGSIYPYIPLQFIISSALLTIFCGDIFSYVWHAQFLCGMIIYIMDYLYKCPAHKHTHYFNMRPKKKNERPYWWAALKNLMNFYVFCVCVCVWVFFYYISTIYWCVCGRVFFFTYPQFTDIYKMYKTTTKSNQI